MIYGGRSGEHEVSLASAAAVFKNLDPARYEAVPIKIEKDGRWSLPDHPPAIDKAADVIHETHAPQLEAEDRVVLRYGVNCNGSMRDIAGILNAGRNVMGMMPHPERAADPLLGGTDGLAILGSLVNAGVTASRP